MENRKMIYLDDAIGAVSKACHEFRGIFGECKDGLLALPSAQPERKKGKWIDNTFCSECGWIHEVESGFIGSVKRFNFCPNCGADMRGEQDEH